ncbi:hypothetical protein KGQ20_21405 [Catenulispora sp. NF23]|uniref:hypothetical protein n=1 Tax=Catenulispora pinistramenti TaxID=2705254 RepID=UPI001BA89510|nr:hypothetical protein [Catenulispora pinistramenti]MBS2535325.1 hypothetical protein [Catenulispora pinistramenti]
MTMNMGVKLLAAGILAAVPVVACAGAASASALAGANPTTTTCSGWKLSGVRYIEACVDVTGSQVHTYGYVSTPGDSAYSTNASVTGCDETVGTFFGDQPSTDVPTQNSTVLLDGTTVTVPAGSRVHATVYLPGVAGTGTLIGPDKTYYDDPDVPSGPQGAPGTPPSVTEQITVWARVTG